MNVQVALSEVLEVKGAPLLETEIWALLYQTVESLQDLFRKGHAVHNQGPSFAITPDTMMLSSHGLIHFAETSFDSVRNEDFVPPEWNPREYFSNDEVERIYVFALGVSIYTCADFKLSADENLDISDDLDNLLGDMCEDDPSIRMTLADILRTCREHNQKQSKRVSNRLQIQQLYKLVLGSNVQLSDLLDSDTEYHAVPYKSRRARSQERPKSAGAQSRPRSRSKNRSRSQSADRHSHFSPSQPRPVPLGRDQTPDYNDIHNHHKYKSLSNLHNVSHGPLPGGYPSYLPPYFGSQPNLFTTYDPYMIPAPMIPSYPGRKIVGQNMKTPHIRPSFYPQGSYAGFRSVPLSYEADEGFSSQASLIKDPHVRQTYERLKDRQRKLQALRNGIDFDEFDSPDAFSSGSDAPTEFCDRRSVRSATSYTQGAYRPDLLEKYGLGKALHLGHDNMDSSPDDQDSSWIQRQEQDIIAMQRALDNFTQPKKAGERQSRPRTKTPVGSRASSKQRPQSRQSSRPSSQQRSQSRGRSKSQGRKRLPNKVPRKFYGPEFIQSDRVYPVTVPTIKTTNQSHLRHIFVHLLNGDKLDVTCEPNTPAKDLFDAVVAHLSLPENYLFGITFSQDSEYFFMDPDQKLSKMAPPHWKDPGKGRPVVAWTTYFKVKFYVQNVNVLQHPVTRRLFYLQLRKDMLEGKLCCNEDQALKMAGYAMQAEYGDWYDKAIGFIPEMYLPPAVMKRVGKAYAKENIPKQHKTHCNVSDEKAEVMFIKEAQQLQDYGMHFYKVYRTKKTTGNPVSAGISVQGIVIAEQRENSKSIIQRHPWQFTQKVSFSRKRFSITPKSDSSTVKLQKLNYYTDNYKKGRYLLHLSTAHHRFQMMMQQTIEPNIQAMIQEEDYSGADWSDNEVDYDDENYDEHEMFDDDYQEDSGEDHDHHSQLYYNRTDGSQDTVLQASEDEISLQRNVPNSRPRSRLSSKDGISTPNTPVASRPTSRPASRPVSRPTSRPTTPGAHVIDVSIRSLDSDTELDHFLPDNELDWLSDSLTQKLEHYPGATISERRIVIVELQKEPQYGIGLTIVGGENTGKLDLGIFVKSITPGGPAHSHGNVNPGDRIIAINGQSLEGMPHHKAVEMIRDSPDVVQLLISQPIQSYPGRGILETDSDASLMDDLDSNRHSSRAGNKKYLPDSLNQIEELRSNSVTLSQLNSVLERSPSVTSSDLELEDVVPAEALKPQYVELHKSPVSPYMNAEMYRQQALKLAEGRRSAELLLAERNATADEEYNGHTSEEELEMSSRKQQDLNRSIDDVSPTSSPEPPSMQSTARSEKPESLDHLKPGDHYEILLKKKSNSLGLNVAGGSNTTVRDGGIYVKSLAENGAAELDARIHIGDKVLEVNGVNLDGVTHKQAVETLRSAPPVCHLLMIRGVPPSPSKTAVSSPPTTSPIASPSIQEDVTLPSSVQTDEGVTSPSVPSEITVGDTSEVKSVSDRNTDVYGFVKEDNSHAVKLEKNSSGLGFSVLGGSDVHPEPLHCLVRVKKIFSHGPAYGSGLEEGDVILQVDNIKLRDLTNKEVMTVLRSTPTQVRLIVCRPEAGVLPSLEELRRDLLDNTMDSEGAFPVAISTPTADLILNDRTPSFTQRNGSFKDQSEIDDEVFSDTDTATPRGGVRNQHTDEDDTETYGTETPMTNRSETTTSRTTPRTPSPVKTFMQDAGLGSYETTPAVTPSIELVASPRSDSKLETADEETEDDVEDMDDDQMSPEIFEVTLTKGHKGLGFTVAGGQQTTGFFYVKDILFDPALSDGRIQKGDRLIMVNGQDMTGMNHTEAVSFLRQTPQTVTLCFERPPEWDDSDGTPTPVPSPNVTPRVAVHSTTEDNTKEQSGVQNLIKGLELGGKVQIIKPYEYRGGKYKQTDEGEDIDEDSLEGNITPRVEQSNKEKKVIKKPVRTKIKTPKFQVTEPVAPPKAEKDMKELTREAGVSPIPGEDGDNYLNTSRDDVMSTVSSFGNITLPMSDLEDHRSTPVKEVKQGGSRSNVNTPEVQTSVIRVELRKPPQGSLGFTLVQGEKGTSSALFVRNITSGGVAERDGRLLIGDKLLQVNGESVIGMPHNKAVALIKKSSGTLAIAVSRATTKPVGTPAATPSKELEEIYKIQINNIEQEKEATLQGLIKAVTPGTDKHNDTDSDVDSATLDDDWGSSPRSVKTATTMGDTSDCEHDDKFNEGSMAYKHFMESKGGVKRAGSTSKVPEKLVPKEKELTRFNRVPTQVTNTWLSTLELIVPPKGNVHYTGRQLQITMKAIKVKIDRDDPVEEYKTLRHHKLTDNCVEARKPENKVKNRYRNVLPYDATRVRLLGPDDYINASHVKYQITKHSMLHYIATQGPMPETTGDFWRMIWELKIEVIAMVTQDMEGGKVKCHRYWPDSMTTPFTIHNRYEVSLINVQRLEHFDIHKIKVLDTEEGESHIVSHLNFTTWPDHGTPESGLPLLQYIKLMHLLHDSGPIVVHCSAGIGRTGALITVDVCRALIESDNKFDIKKIVQDIRRQRQGMIQTKDQYRFCYKTIIDALATINKEIMSVKNMGDTM